MLSISYTLNSCQNMFLYTLCADEENLIFDSSQTNMPTNGFIMLLIITYIQMKFELLYLASFGKNVQSIE